MLERIESMIRSHQSYRNDLILELSVINASGYPGYFLIVQDFTTVARELGVSVGPGRGQQQDLQ